MDARRERGCGEGQREWQTMRACQISQQGQRRRGCSREALPRSPQNRRSAMNSSAIGSSEIPRLCWGEEPAGSRATPSSMALMIYRIIYSAILGLVAIPAHAYCIYNQLPDRSVTIEQEPHPDKLRDERRLRATLKPGANHFCPFHRLHCHTGRRNNSVMNIAVTIT